MTAANKPKRSDRMSYDDIEVKVNKKGKTSFMRDDIEEVIKEKHIDRTRFHEFSKNDYTEIFKKFYFTFADIKNFPVGKQTLEINRLHFRSDLKKEVIDCFLRTQNWCEYMNTIKADIPDNEIKLFLLLASGWVYEGKREEMFSVLSELCYICDFYIISSKFTWFIAVDHLSDNAVIYKR